MKYSLNGLKHWVDIPLNAQELADRLCAFGLEVEEIHPVAEKVSGIKTGKLTQIRPHPQADRLVITTFWDGTAEHQIVTGAPNVFEGAIVPASLPGAILADGTLIKSGVLRGVESHGMLCSQTEMGIPTEQSGIWILPPDTPLGLEMVDYAHLKDVILEVSILPNRSDCKSHFGLAREIAAMLKTPLKSIPDQPETFTQNWLKEWLKDTLAPSYTPDPVYATEPSPIAFDPTHINALLGTEWVEYDMISALNALGFRLNPDKTITVPLWRQSDVQNKADLAEEIARSLGLDTIPTCLPKACIPVTPPTPLQTLTQEMETALIGLGMQQVNTLPMISTEDIHQTPCIPFTLQNPISPELAIMRPTLLPSLLKILKHNTRHFNPYHRLFEIGKIYHYHPDQTPEIQREERLVTGILISAPLYETAYTGPEKQAYTLEFADLKGIVETLLEKNKTLQVAIQAEDTPLFHPVQHAKILSGKIPIGEFGFLHPQFLQKHDLKGPVGYIELDLTTLVTLPTPKLKAKPFSKFPSTRRDMAILAPKNLSYQKLITTIKSIQPKLLQSTFVFDLYTDPSWTEPVQSIGIACLYQDPTGTITDDIVNAAHQKLCQDLAQKLPINFR